MSLEDNEDPAFLAHAKATFDRRLKLIATPIHWLALFLHPLCRKLAVSDTVHGHSLDFMIETALKIALQWKWDARKALQLKDDLKRYFQCKAPFGGGSRDALDWWEGISKDKHSGIRILAIFLASIVPHAADVERLFSDLGGIQTWPSTPWRRPGKFEAASTMSFMSLLERRTNLENPITWIPPLDGAEDDAGEDIVEKACQDLEKIINDEAPTTIAAGSIIAGELVDFAELDRFDRGETAGVNDDEIEIIGNGPTATWSIEDLMKD
ncbi:hypothetical protein B0H17DRAFT_1137026 [Mycena rosella]|uniref:HAT C-terminal dimerisation domain-containing protein n=1 Tax=Mycena rosella TaxID=1033263 RepID=A0AAD7GDS6_MYCRO|nr:hypothetical protein B0H17DRAFT_1137026 [Mycena rosella]